MRFIFHECRNLFRAAAAHIVEAQSIEIRLFLINERNYSHARAEIMRWVSIKTLLCAWHAMIDMGLAGITLMMHADIYIVHQS